MAKGAMVIVGADVKDAVVGLDSVGVAAKKAGTDVAGSFQAPAPGVAKFTNATADLEKQLKGVAQEMKQGDRIAGFYAKQMVEVAGGSTQAKEGLSGMIGLGLELANVMKFGLGPLGAFMLALEALKMGVTVFNSIGNSAKKLEEQNKANAESTKSVSAAWATLHDLVKETQVLLMGTSREAAVQAARNQNEKERLTLVEKQQEAEKKLADARKSGVWFDISNAASSLEALNQAYTQSWEKEKAQLANINKEWNAKELDAKKQLEADKAKAAKDALEKLNQQILDSVNSDMASGMFSGFEDASRMESPKEFQTYNQTENERIKEEVRQDELSGAYSGYDTPDLAKTNEKVKTSIDLAKELKDAYSQVGAGIASTFSTIGSAIGGTAGEFISQIGAMIAQTLALIVALATSDTLMMGPLGVFAAIPMAAGILASVVGMIAGIGAREMGGPVLAGQPYLVGERGPELVTFGQSGYVTPNNKLGGMGGGGMVVNINASSLDAAWWKKNQAYVLGTIKDAGRNRRTV